MQKRPRMAFPRSLSGIIQDSLTGFGLSERLREAEIWRIWPDVVGAAISCRTSPVRIINGVLTVVVSSAPWIQELRFMTAMMKEKINSRLGAEVVRDIVLKAGKVATPPEELVEEVPHKHTLTPLQIAQIEEQASSIKEPDTRLAFIELMKSSMERDSFN